MSSSSSEIFRRGIVLPLNGEALLNIRMDKIGDKSDFKFIKFEDDDQFYRIWKTGLFVAINKGVGSLIDDYEQEEISSAWDILLNEVRRVAQTNSLKKNDRVLLEGFYSLISMARTIGMPLFFVF